MSDSDKDTDVDGADPVEDTESAKIQAVATIVPVHAVTQFKRGPGRPRKIQPQATVDTLAYHAEIAKRRAKFIDENPLVRAVKDRKDSMEVLQRAKEEVAKTAAALQFTRIEEEKYGRDTAQTSSRHIAALREVAMLELEMRKLGSSIIDLKSERFTKIFNFLVGVIKETAIEVLSPEEADLFLNRLSTKLEGWEDVAQNL